MAGRRQAARPALARDRGAWFRLAGVAAALECRAAPDNVHMTQEIDLIYDAAVADEKLKNGTKYERLTAIVFQILHDSACVVHDVHLRGDGKQARHQIDVEVSAGPQHERRRVLVECKDHGPGTKVGLSEVRDFNGALIQLQPARGIFVTTSDYTGPALVYARDENIALAVLRPFTGQDWGGRLREIDITAIGYSPGTPATEWTPTGRTASSPPGLALAPEATRFDSTWYYDENGQAQGTLLTLLDEWWGEVNATVPTDGTAEMSGSWTLQEPTWLLQDGQLSEVTGFTWTAPVEHMTSLIKVDQGKRIVDLILRSVHAPGDAQLSDVIAAGPADTPGQVFTRDQIALWKVGDDHVIRPAAG